MNKEDGLKASSMSSKLSNSKHQTRLFAVLVLVTECSDNTKSTLTPEANEKTKQKKKERLAKKYGNKSFSQ